MQLLLVVILGIATQGAVGGDVADLHQQLRGDKKGHKEIPGWGTPRWGGRAFHDSPVADNDWVNMKPPIPVVDDLNPVAPMDRLDGKSAHGSLTGAMPAMPSTVMGSHVDAPPPMAPDYVPPQDSRMRVFPLQAPRGGLGPSAMEGGLDNPEGSSPLIHIARRHLVAKADRLRPPPGPPIVGDLTEDFLNSAAENYPLSAPIEYFPGGPEAVAPVDKVPADVARYLEQRVDREAKLAEAKRVELAWRTADANMDGLVSADEFKAELSGRQGKKNEEVQRLWEKYHHEETKYMNKAEFQRLARTGFDLGTIPRKDVSHMFAPQELPGLGFWGSGASCPVDTYVKGVSLKIMPQSSASDPKDDSGINAVKFRCSDKTEVTTIEAKDGEWQPWAECPAGQVVYSFRYIGKKPVTGHDNAGLEGLEFGCRSQDLSEVSKLDFAKLGGSVEGEGKPNGRWSKDYHCQASESICGAQANILQGHQKGDAMGVTSMRFYCCQSSIDCTSICSDATSGIKEVKCRVCKKGAGAA